MINFVENYCEFPSAFRRPMWRIWHNLLIRFVKDSSVSFMNYGYEGLNGDPFLHLDKSDERDRYCIQLYHHLANSVDLKNKRVLEIGSGRGGGAHFIARYHKPLQYTGIDISSSVINFCKRSYSYPGLKFEEGRAEKVPFDNQTYDAVVNVESARCYSNINTFFSEVYRVLHPEGHFLFADMIDKNEVDSMRHKLNDAGFEIIAENDITKNVAKGLELDSDRRQQLISRKIPGLLRSYFESFAGTKGTKRFESFQNGRFRYKSYVLVKKEIAN